MSNASKRGHLRGRSTKSITPPHLKPCEIQSGAGRVFGRCSGESGISRQTYRHRMWRNNMLNDTAHAAPASKVDGCGWTCLQTAIVGTVKSSASISASKAGWALRAEKEGHVRHICLWYNFEGVPEGLGSFSCDSTCLPSRSDPLHPCRIVARLLWKRDGLGQDNDRLKVYAVTSFDIERHSGKEGHSRPDCRELGCWRSQESHLKAVESSSNTQNSSKGESHFPRNALVASATLLM